MVTTNTTQEITGSKEFSGTTSFTNNVDLYGSTTNIDNAYVGYMEIDPDNLVFNTSGLYRDMSSALSDLENVVSDVQNIPTTATSTSTVTPTTVTLTFTYSDDTTENVTLMTGATVATTTTLS